MAPAVRIAAALLAVSGLVALDLGSKAWAASELRRRGARTVARGQVVLHYHENRGAALGLLRGRAAARWPLVAYGAAMSLGLAALLARALVRPRPGATLVTAGLCALLAGTIGNLADRAVRGFVVDFIDWGGGRVRFPIFNLADAALAAGIALCSAGLALRAARSLRTAA